MTDREFPQSLALAIDAALDEMPGRLIVLSPRVVSIRARLSDASEKIDSIWIVEAEVASTRASRSVSPLAALTMPNICILQTVHRVP